MMGAAKSKKDVLDALAGGLVPVLDASGAAVLLAEDDEKLLVGYLGRPVDKWPGITKVTIDLEDTCAACAAFKTRRPIVISNTMTDASTKKWLAELYDCRSVLLVPIIGKERLGCLVISETRRSRHFTDDEVRVVVDLTEMAAQAIERLGPDAETRAG